RTGNSPRLARRFVVRFGPLTRTTASLPFGGLTTIVTPCAAPPTIVVAVSATTPDTASACSAATTAFAHGVPSTYSAALYVWAGRPTDDLPERNRAHSASASPQSAGGGSTRKIGSAGSSVRVGPDEPTNTSGNFALRATVSSVGATASDATTTAPANLSFAAFSTASAVICASPALTCVDSTAGRFAPAAFASFDADTASDTPYATSSCVGLSICPPGRTTAIRRTTSAPSADGVAAETAAIAAA